MKNKTKKIWFIVLVSAFATLLAASLVFLGFATLGEETVGKSITDWYEGKHEDKALNLLSKSMWAVVINSFALIVVLLAKELKKKYLVR